MLDELWSGLIRFTEQFVVPDWGALVGLLPVVLAVVVVLYLTWVVYRLATAGPTRRGVRRLPPVAPSGIHMPGPSFAPVLAAVGVFLLVFGMVAGGLWLWVGLVAVVITLLYWGREALRDYDHIPSVAGEHPAVGALPAPAGTPPAGVHMPPPSFRPLLVAVSMTLLVAGMVVGGWALWFGLIAVVLVLLGWLRDARHEYAATEAADRTGHLDLGGAPPWPKATFAAMAVIVAGALLLSSGILPNAGGGAVPSGGPAASDGGAGGGGGGASPAPSLPAADVVVVAENIAWLETSITVPAGRAFTIAFDNRDRGVPHDIVIKDAAGAELFRGDVVTGPAVVVYDVPAIPAGQHPFVCSIHPNMTGTVTAQ
ncbi:MAG: cupredoxin domain-containing protein [Chloroflexota bacterium]